MKKMLILLLALTSLLYAKIDLEIAVRIENFPENLFIDDRDIDANLDEICSNFYQNKVRSEYGGIGCGYAGLCRSMLDSNVLLGWTGGYKGFFGGSVYGAIEFYVLTESVHTVREIIKEEFVHYRKCYLFTENDSIFDSMLAKIDSLLIPVVDECLVNKNCVYKPIIFDYTWEKIRGVIAPGPNFEFGGFIDDTLKARNSAISSIAPARYLLETIRVQNHRLMVPAKLENREYALFDVNGHEIRRGKLVNNMQVPAYPVVIKIQGFGTKLLNSR